MVCKNLSLKLYFYQNKRIYFFLMSIESLISSDSDGTEMPTKEFVFTFSADEWNQIHPLEVFYKLNDKSRPMQNSK